MTRSKLFSIVSITLSSLVTWLYIVTQVQPNKQDTFVMLTFFMSLAVWVGSISAILIYLYKVKQSNREIIYAHIQPSIRQGALVGLYITSLLFFQLLGVLSLWEAILVLAVFILFEIAMRHNETTRKTLI